MKMLMFSNFCALSKYNTIKKIPYNTSLVKKNLAKKEVLLMFACLFYFK